MNFNHAFGLILLPMIQAWPHLSMAVNAFY